MSDLDRDPRDMRDDARAWARLNYPAITVGRYADAADQIQRLRAQLAEAQRDAERWRWYRNHRVTHGSVLEEDIDSAMTAKEGG